MRQIILALSLLSLLGLTACGGDDKEGDKTTTAASSETGCKQAAEPKPRDVKLAEPTSKLDSGATYTATVKTSCGSFTIKLATRNNPKTAASFVYMAKKGLYDGLTFHRIASGFVIQGGDPSGDGTGGPGYSVVEAPAKDTAYTRGLVAMAKAGDEKAGTSGSQFFVVTADDAQLPPEYAVLGRVTKGMDTVDRIAAVPTASASTDPAEQERPLDPVVIESVSVKQS